MKKTPKVKSRKRVVNEMSRKRAKPKATGRIKISKRS